MTTFGMIGTGQMGGALAKALCAKVGGGQVFLSDCALEKAQALAARLGAVATDNATAAGCTYVVLAVKPQHMEALLASLRPILEARQDRFVLVSIAAGLEIATLQQMAGAPYPLLRIMPNTPVSIGAGMCLYAKSPELTQAEAEEFLSACSCAGSFDEISESLMNVGTSLTSCSPAFVSMFLEAMADGGVACGLPRAKALEYAARAIAGTAQLYLAERKHPGEMKDAVCSPGGSTIAGVRALEQAGFRAAVMDAVEATCNKGRALGQIGSTK